MQPGCYYRRDQHIVQVYYTEAGNLVARNPRTGSIVPVASLPRDGWVQTDEVWRVIRRN